MKVHLYMTICQMLGEHIIL